MKIEAIHIQKFRSIDDATISFQQVMAIVGANNVGKSHVLRALNAFFNFEQERECFEKQDHAFSTKSRPKITVVFTDISPDDGVLPRYISNNHLTVRMTYRWDRKSPTYEYKSGPTFQTIDLEIFKSIFQKFRFIYVPTRRDSTSTFSNDNGIAYDLLSGIVRQQVANRNMLQPRVKALFDKLEKTVFSVAQQRIKKFYPFETESDFRLKFANNDPIDTIIHDITLELLEFSQSNSIENCGSGVQSAIYLAVSLAAYMENGLFFLVGIEEPEQNMHPQAQRKLVESLRNTIRYPNTQFVLTTHSPVIIDRLGHDAICLCKKEKGPTRDIVTTVSQIQSDFWQKYAFTEERYYNYFRYRNSDFFFSDYIIITESKIDCEVYSALLDIYGISIDEHNISLIPLDGEKSIKYPYAIAKELKIPFICIVDRDVFQPYCGQSRKNSLGRDGLPKYKGEVKLSSPFCDLITESDAQQLLVLLEKNKYSDALEMLEKYNLILMKYSLEVDLICCNSYFQAFCDEIGVAEKNRSIQYLLTEQSNKIKTTSVICGVLNRVNCRNLPASYRQVIRRVKALLDR